MTRRALLAALPLAAGCLAEPVEGVQLLVPGDVEFPWNAAYNAENDGRAAVLPLDVMVYDPGLGEALVGVEIELAGADTRFLSADVVWPGEPGCAPCLWDAYRDEYVEVADASPEEPLVVETDAAGLARVYAVVDALPRRADGAFAPAVVRVSVADAEQTVLLVPR